MLTKIIKNATGSAQNILNRQVANGDSYNVPSYQWLELYSDELIAARVAAGTYIMNDGTSDLSAADGYVLIKKFQPFSISSGRDTELRFYHTSNIHYGNYLRTSWNADSEIDPHPFFSPKKIMDAHYLFEGNTNCVIGFYEMTNPSNPIAVGKLTFINQVEGWISNLNWLMGYRSKLAAKVDYGSCNNPSIILSTEFQ